MGHNSASPVAFNTVSMVTTALGANDGQLGQRRFVDGKEYVLVYNGGGASAMVGAGVVLNSAATNYTVTVSAATSADLVIGVVHTATLTTGAYGWVVRKGITPIQMLAASSSVSARGLVEVGSDGLWAPVSNTTGNKAAGCGLALAAIVTGASGNAFVSCYG